MNTPIPAAEIGAQIYQILLNTVEQEFAGEPDSVKQEALFDILTAMSFQMFK